jgi:hypothetical protein
MTELENVLAETVPGLDYSVEAELLPQPEWEGALSAARAEGDRSRLGRGPTEYSRCRAGWVSLVEPSP